MSIRKYLFRILLLSSIVYSMSCNDENVNVEGMLVYTNGGSSLDSIALSVESDKSLSLYKSKEMVAINNITNVNGEVILFGECAVTGGCFVKQYSFETRQDVLLRSGRLPSYISNHHKLFFYDKASDGYNWLFVTSLKNINDATKIAKEPEWKTLPNGISQPVTMSRESGSGLHS